MTYEIQYILNNNFYLKKYLRENSEFYKDLIRNPNFINTLNEMMKKKYKLTVSDRLTKIKDDINMLNSVMDILK